MEWITELFGFLIVLIVFLLPVLRKFIIDKRKKQEQKEPQEEEEEEYQEEMEMEEEALPLSPEEQSLPISSKRLVKKDYAFETDLESREFENVVEDRKFKSRIAPQVGRRLVSEEFILDKARKKKRAAKNPIVALTKNKDPLQAMVILSEVFGRYQGPN